MANKYMDSSFLDRAIIFAVKAHAFTERRDKGFPYIVHPLEAMTIVATMTNDQEMLAAAVLHDTIEDTEVTAEQIRAKFGDRVADLVIADSDVLVNAENKEENWRLRKQQAIDRLATASLDAKIVALGDKLSNMRAIARDFEEKGSAVWNIFRMKDPKIHEWHYRGLASSLSELKGTSAYREFTALIEKVFLPYDK